MAFKPFMLKSGTSRTPNLPLPLLFWVDDLLRPVPTHPLFGKGPRFGSWRASAFCAPLNVTYVPLLSRRARVPELPVFGHILVLVIVFFGQANFNNAGHLPGNPGHFFMARSNLESRLMMVLLARS